jgi:hypothetical protein
MSMRASRSILSHLPRFGAVALALAALAGPAGAVDVDPGDYEPAPAGVTAGIVYGQHAQRSRLYGDGSSVLTNAQLTSDVALLRPVHYFDVGGMRSIASVILPVGRLSANGDLAGLGATTGFGDPILQAGLWPFSDAAARRHLGVCGYLFVPVGAYDRARGLNLGNNRWEYALQAGFAQGFGQRWSAELVADAAFFSKNTSFGPARLTMAQAPQFQLQGYLSFLPTATTRLAVGLSQLTGGETTVAGIKQNDAASTLKASLTLASWLAPTSQVQVTVGKDFRVENGLREDFRLNLRVTQVF